MKNKAAESFQLIFKDNNFGYSVSERRAQFKKAKRSATIMNWVAGIVAVWSFFWPEPYAVAIVASILCPIAALVLLKVFNGLIRMEDQKNSPYPSLFWAFFIPSMALALRALLDLNIYDHGKVWWLVLLMSAILSGVLFLGNKEFDWRKGKRIFTTLVIVCITVAYSYGALLCSNCALDQSNAAGFYAQILEKEMSTGKTSSYYFTLAPWGPRTSVEEVPVDKVVYQQLEKGETARVLFFEGRWGIPWFIVKP